MRMRISEARETSGTGESPRPRGESDGALRTFADLEGRSKDRGFCAQVQAAQKGRLLTRPTLARRDAPCPKQGRIKILSVSPHSFYQRVSVWLWVELAGHMAAGAAGMLSTARVQRGPSQAARCASTEDHQPPSPSPFIVGFHEHWDQPGHPSPVTALIP